MDALSEALRSIRGAIVQIESLGPTSTDFINAADDPRGDR